jgi:hypothetical protein
VAVRSTEEWGVPMRQPEVEEMETRERYVDQAAEVIPEWAQAHASSTYGGFYVDERAGSKIYVGFTANQAANLEALKNSGSLIAPSGQIAGYPAPPTVTAASLEASEEEVFNALVANPSLEPITSGVSYNPEANVVEVETTNVTTMTSAIQSMYGSGAPIVVVAGDEAQSVAGSYGRFKTRGPVAGGQALYGLHSPTVQGLCTAGFGAEALGPGERGHSVHYYYTLTAGHCFSPSTNTKVYRSPARHPTTAQLEGNAIGSVKKYAFGSPKEKAVDGEAINVPEPYRTHGVFFGDPNNLLSVQGVERARVGMHVCWSAVQSGVECGKISRRGHFKAERRRVTEMVVARPVITGDSGSPVWNLRTEKAVGLISLGLETAQKECRELHTPPYVGSEWCPRMAFTPLLPLVGEHEPAGIATALHVSISAER